MLRTGIDLASRRDKRVFSHSARPFIGALARIAEFDAGV